MIKKTIGTLFALVVLASVNGFAKDSTGIKLSLLPSIATSRASFVGGVDIGLLGTRTDTVHGLQWSIFYSRVNKKSIGAQGGLYAKSPDFDGAKWGVVSISDNFRGYNTGFVCLAKSFIGYQSGYYCQNSSIKGMQLGLVNVSQEVSGLQLGVVNYTRRMNGVQIGVVNIITESSLPVMIVLNAKFQP